MILASVVRLIIDDHEGAFDVCGKVAEKLLMANILFTITLYSWMEQATVWVVTRALKESLFSHLLLKKIEVVADLAQVDELLISKDVIIEDKFTVAEVYENGEVREYSRYG